MEILLNLSNISFDNNAFKCLLLQWQINPSMVVEELINPSLHSQYLDYPNLKEPADNKFSIG